MKIIIAVLAFACLALPASAGDTTSPGAQTPAQPGGIETPSGRIETPGGVQAPGAIPNPGSSQVPSQTPGTQPNPGSSQTPSQPPTAQVLNDVRAAVMQIPGTNLQGTLPGTEVETSRIQNLRVFPRSGQIVLTGTVATQAEKDAATIRARQAAGGQVIMNQLEVR